MLQVLLRKGLERRWKNLEGSYVIGLSDLVLLANAYGTSGNGHAVPFKLGGLGVWEPGADLAPPASIVGLSDLVKLALNYGKHWGANP